EIDRFRTTLTAQDTVPTSAFKTGVFTYTDPSGAQLPVDLTPTGAANVYGFPIDPTMQKVLALYPNATTSGNGFSGQYFFPSGSKTNISNSTVKIDHHFTDRETLSLRYGYDHFFDPNAFPLSDILPGGIAAIGEKAINQGVSAQLTSTLSN